MRLSLERDTEREDEGDTSNTISTSPKDDANKYNHKSDSKIFICLSFTIGRKNRCNASHRVAKLHLVG
jgi:hypothetical protein